ncbi:hypothetical protein K438DRAFT_1771626 [Mycena galopus ATCC 62051]|nr:hypothetical protein K438DRAFT_1771626 [Mycena galopus ATCC 62051]
MCERVPELEGAPPSTLIKKAATWASESDQKKQGRSNEQNQGRKEKKASKRTNQERESLDSDGSSGGRELSRRAVGPSRDRGRSGRAARVEEGGRVISKPSAAGEERRQRRMKWGGREKIHFQASENVRGGKQQRVEEGIRITFIFQDVGSAGGGTTLEEEGWRRRDHIKQDILYIFYSQISRDGKMEVGIPSSKILNVDVFPKRSRGIL